MIYKKPLPWDQSNLGTFLKLFETEEEISVTWYWEPFHRPGFNALTLAAQRQMSQEDFEKTIRNLSCPGAPIHLRKKLSSLLDEENRVLPLDPQSSISSTFRASHQSIPSFQNKDLVLPTIGDLRRRVPPKTLQTWQPVLKGTPELDQLSTWLTDCPWALNRIHSLSGWEKLELIETSVGVTKSSSNLQFNRIYRK